MLDDWTRDDGPFNPGDLVVMKRDGLLWKTRIADDLNEDDHGRLWSGETLLFVCNEPNPMRDDQVEALVISSRLRKLGWIRRRYLRRT